MSHLVIKRESCVPSFYLDGEWCRRRSGHMDTDCTWLITVCRNIHPKYKDLYVYYVEY